MKGNIACKYEISTYVKDNVSEILFVNETLLSAHSDEAKTVELVPSKLHMK